MILANVCREYLLKIPAKRSRAGALRRWVCLELFELLDPKGHKRFCEHQVDKLGNPNADIEGATDEERAENREKFEQMWAEKKDFLSETDWNAHQEPIS